MEHEFFDWKQLIAIKTKCCKWIFLKFIKFSKITQPPPLILWPSVLWQKFEYSIMYSIPDYVPKNGPPNNFTWEQSKIKSLMIGVIGTYKKVISLSYNHCPKPNDLGDNWTSSYLPFWGRILGIFVTLRKMDLLVLSVGIHWNRRIVLNKKCISYFLILIAVSNVEGLLRGFYLEMAGPFLGT